MDSCKTRVHTNRRQSHTVADTYPAISEFCSGWGWIEVGEATEITGIRGITARALDAGGMIWECKRPYKNVVEAFRALEVALKKVIALGN